MPNSIKSRSSSGNEEEEDGEESKENESQLSPPSYSVVEDSNGSLVNLELEVKWPQRPKKGHYSKEEYLKRKNDRRLQQKQQQRRHGKTHKESKPTAKSPEDLSDSDKFVGCLSSSHVEEFLRPTEFVLYYRRPDAIVSFDEMPICMPLSMAYMTSKNKVYHFGIDSFEDEYGTLWTVVLGNGKQQPYFRTMKGLIDYYTGFGYLRKDGSIELFNVPEN